jgi:hypothetical protein
VPSAIVVLNCTGELSGRRFHQYSCECEGDDHDPEVNPQWVRRRTNLFSSISNTTLKIDFRRFRVASEGGPILVRELGEQLGLGELIQQHPTHERPARYAQFPYLDSPGQSVFSRRKTQLASTRRGDHSNGHNRT